MNDVLSALLLLSVPGLPLLLVFPALHSRLRWSCHLTLLPAVILLALPVNISVELPWLLFGTGLGINGAGRLMLAMSVLLWAAAATLLHTAKGEPVNQRLTTCFLLTMAGSLGAILATELVGFFTFSVLMGYGLYGLLVDGGDEESRRAAHIYLVFLILADLALFEALLIAAATTDDLGFGAVGYAMAQSSSSGLYLAMVLVGFAAKAGVWPLHFWLSSLFRSARPAVALLLGAVPIAIALLGIVRWLPLGEISSPLLGLIIQGLGVTAMLYAIAAGLMRAQLKTLPAYAAIFATGLFSAILGAGLSDPVLWNRYQYLIHFFIISVGVGLSILTVASAWLQAKSPTTVKPIADASPWFERWLGVVLLWGKQVGFDTLPRLRAAWLAKVDRLWHPRTWKKILDDCERLLQHWSFAITLFLLLGIVVVFISASF